jgi:hypothetical protein
MRMFWQAKLTEKRYAEIWQLAGFNYYHNYSLASKLTEEE